MEIPEEHVPERASARETELVKEKEGGLLAKNIRESDFVVVLDPRGETWSSEELAGKIKGWEISGTSRVAFLIGGPLGLSDVVRKRADVLLSLSKMTFTHPMTRLILLEQIYRAFRIIRGEPYHK